MARAGFLWDSLSRNTGDQAIGLAVLRLARQAGLSALKAFRIGHDRRADFDVLLIGGGELLTSEGNPYYDLFRVPGEHILNTVGTSGPAKAAYLNEYRLVSVRSDADRLNLQGVRREVRVAPCLSVLFEEIAADPPAIARDANCVGLQIQPGAIVAGTSAQLLEAMRSLGSAARLLPFTHYNHDRELQETLAEAIGLPAPLSIESPDDAFAAIRRMRALVTSSLHATIMAYAAGVPFLAIPYHPKVASFLQERNLSLRILPALADLPAHRELLEPSSVDWAPRLERDKALARQLAQDMFGEIERGLRATVSKRSLRSLTNEPIPEHAVAAHRLMIDRHGEYGRRIVEVIRGELASIRANEYCQKLEGEIRLLQQDQRGTADYSRAMEDSVRSTNLQLHASAAHARSLEARLASIDVQLATATEYARSLEANLRSTTEAFTAAGVYARSLEGRIEVLSSELASRRRPRIQAIVVHHRGRELLERCLAALQSSRGVELETVVVANSCKEPLPERALGSPGVHVVESPTALGFSAANNLGVEWARHNLGEPEHYFFANNDLRVEATTLLSLAEALNAWPRGGIAGPTLSIWGAEQFINSLGLNVTEDGEAWDEGIGVSFAAYGPLPPTREVIAVTGSALLIRVAAFADLRGWGPLYGYYMEDIDLCLRARSRGWRVIHCPDSRAAHAVSATSDDLPDFKRLSSWRNRFVLLTANWPLARLARIGPLIAARELVVFFRRLKTGQGAAAKLQLRAWTGAMRRLAGAWASRRWGGDADWTHLLKPRGSVPVITLPRVPTRQQSPTTEPAASSKASPRKDNASGVWNARLLETRRGVSWLEAPEVVRRYHQKAGGAGCDHWVNHCVKKHLRSRPTARMLFAGCGTGELDRTVLGLMRAAKGDAYDSSLSGLAAARAAALAERNDRLRYFAADANVLVLPSRAYDAIWFRNSLHHVASLEHALDQVRKALKPRGILICVEYVGANAFNFGERQREALVEAFALIPPRLRRNLSGSGPEIIPSVGIPNPAAVRADDPTEAVRSEDILRCISERFRVVEQRDLGGSVLQYALNNIAGNFTPDDPESSAVLKKLFALEDHLMADGELKSDFVYLVAVPD